MRQPSSGTPTRGHATSCRRARSWPPRQTPGGDGTLGGAQPLPDPWVLPLWYLPTGTLAHAAQAVEGAFPQPLLPGVALLRSLQAGAAWIRWREEGGRQSPYFPLVRGQALLHTKGMGSVRWGAIVSHTACRWITAAAPQPMRSPPACHRLLRAVPSLAPHQALTKGIWRAMLSHRREWMTNPGARCPPRPVLEQLTAPKTRGPPRPAQGAGPYGTAHRRGAGPSAGASAGALPADPHPACRYIQPPGPPGIAAPCRGRAPGRLGETVANTPQPVHRTRPLAPALTPLPTPAGPGAPPTEPIPHAPGAPGRAELPAARPARPSRQGKARRRCNRTPRFT